jgi:hypothetical protein
MASLENTCSQWLDWNGDCVGSKTSIVCSLGTIFTLRFDRDTGHADLLTRVVRSGGSLMGAPRKLCR